MKKCKLTILDQVNIKFSDVDASCRRDIVEALKLMVPYARHTPMFKMGRWDGKVAFATVGGASYLNLLGDILPVLERHGYDLSAMEIDDRRVNPVFDFPVIDDEFFADTVWPEGHPMVGEPIMMRDHQVTAVNTFTSDLQSIQEIATGAGKTIICAALSRMIEPYGRSLIIVPGKDLVRQTFRDYENIGLDTGRYYGDFKEPDRTHTIATWQSLSAAMKNNPDMVDTILDNTQSVIIDECFAKGTPVLTPTGYVPIEQLQSGDEVINYCEIEKVFKADTVVKLHTNISTEPMYELLTDTGATIHVTGNHKFLTTRGWIRVDEISESDEIINHEGNIV